MSAHTRGAALDAQRWMKQAFGTSIPALNGRLARDDMSLHVEHAVRLLANGGVAELIAKWRAEEGISKRGRKHTMSEVSALALLFVQMRVNGDLQFNTLAKTLMHLSEADREKLGIRGCPGYQQAYDRIWRAIARLHRLVDPYPGPRYRRLTDQEYKAVLAQRASRDDLEAKAERLHTLINAILEGSIGFLPRELRRKFAGNIAIDATYVPMRSRSGIPSGSRSKSNVSINYDAGWYVRSGDHNGANAKSNEKQKWGLEIEIACAIANDPDAKGDFPLLALAMGWHTPGSLTGEARKLLESMWGRGYDLNHVVADRAYLPSSQVMDLQYPAVTHKMKIVSEYKITQLGIQGYYKDVQLIDGSWYVAVMPEQYKHAEKAYRDGMKESENISDLKERAAFRSDLKQLRDQLLRARRAYRLKPRTGFRSDGSRQYSYPKLDDIEFFYDADGTIIEPRPEFPVSIVIPAILNEHEKEDSKKYAGIKYGQEYEYRSETYFKWWGLRNTVESINNHVKESNAEDLQNPGKRRARGNTFTVLASAVALASVNLRKIVKFLQNRLATKTLTSKNIFDRASYYDVADDSETAEAQTLAEPTRESRPSQAPEPPPRR
jgi:hypothetical protein